MITFTIDIIEVEGEKEQSVFEVAVDNRFDIPHLCYHDALKPYGACPTEYAEVIDAKPQSKYADCG
jgi:NADH dehydrogenase/NADH:ubiquinone oxidoreductase subunit G